MTKLTTPVRNGMIAIIAIILVVAVGTAVARSGKSTSSSKGTPTTTLGTARSTTSSGPTTTTAEPPTTAAPAATPTTAVAGATATTVAQSGLGTGGAGQVAMGGEVPKTGGDPFVVAAVLLLCAGAVVRRLVVTSR
ncbi:MAG: hypothetical protein JWO37_194 [Acidimicrobiales bacterium]|nr:hypothetical protein [Acidimicrobiales bacterium]